MSSANELLAALNAGTFESALDGVLGSLDKNELSELMVEMESKSDEISDQSDRHLFKNGIASLKMFIDSM